MSTSMVSAVAALGVMTTVALAAPARRLRSLVTIHQTYYNSPRPDRGSEWVDLQNSSAGLAQPPCPAGTA